MQQAGYTAALLSARQSVRQGEDYGGGGASYMMAGSMRGQPQQIVDYPSSGGVAGANLAAPPAAAIAPQAGGNEDYSNNIDDNGVTIDPFSSVTIGPGMSIKDSARNSALNLIVKIILYTCIALQVVIWPSVMTITFASVLAFEGLVNLLTISAGWTAKDPSTGRSRDTVYGNLTEYSVLLLHNRKVTTGKYIVACAITAYLLIFFVLFVSHEASLQPIQTPWLDSSVYGKYSPETDDAPLSGPSLSSSFAVCRC